MDKKTCHTRQEPDNGPITEPFFIPALGPVIGNFLKGFKAQDMTILNLTHDEFCKKIKDRFGKGRFYATPIYREAFGRGSLNGCDLTAFSENNPLLKAIQQDYGFNLNPIVKKETGKGVLKWVTQLEDGCRIESVVIPMAHYVTLCISSQVGCKMGCRFCKTGQLGFQRNLSPHEIVEQVINAKVILKLNVRNIVFMGMGEPLDNFSNTLQAIRIMADQRGLNIAERRMTLSTVGIASKIDDLARMNVNHLNLAVSLNAPDNTIRTRLMPINQKYAMDRLKQSLMNYPLGKGQYLWIQYVLIKDVNDQKHHADALARFLSDLKVKVNVIPYNEGGCTPFVSPMEKDTERFISYLIAHKIFVRKRKPKGEDLLAACGQLGETRLH